MRRNRFGSNGSGASTRAALAACAAALLLAPSETAKACGYHGSASASIGMLNWAYPDSLHVRTAVWMAQAGGLLPAREPLPVADPLSATFRFQQSLRFQAAQAGLEQLRGRADAALAGQPVLAFAVVLIEPMLWTRFESREGGLTLIQHAAGPAQDDVVIVTDEPVVAALAGGRISAGDARAHGLVKVYGTSDAVERVSALLDRIFPSTQVNASR